jgi:hypothetical protein
MTEPDIYDLAAQAEQSRTDTDKKTDPDKTEPEVTEPSETDPDEVEMHMTYPQLRTAAYNGEFPNEKYPMPDRIFFWALRDMYQRFKAGKITKEQGDSERKTAEKLYRRDRAKYEMYTSTVQNITSFWKRVEAAASDYAKSDGRTPEADALFEAVYNAIPKG